MAKVATNRTNLEHTKALKKRRNKRLVCKWYVWVCELQELNSKKAILVKTTNIYI